MIPTTIPNPKNLYRPRAEEILLGRLIDAAWKQKMTEDISPEETAQVGEIAARHFEARIPATDLAVLEKYGVAHPSDNVFVRNYNEATSRYDQYFDLKLPRPVPYIADNGLSLRANGPKWGFQPDDKRGVNPETVAEYKADGRWEKLKADQDASELRCVREVDPYFAKLGALRAGYETDRSNAAKWIEQYKRVHGSGKYPRWEDIEEALPVLGRFLAAEREVVKTALQTPAAAAPAKAVRYTDASCDGHPLNAEWIARVDELEVEGLTRSDAQGAADAEFMDRERVAAEAKSTDVSAYLPAAEESSAQDQVL